MRHRCGQCGAHAESVIVDSVLFCRFCADEVWTRVRASRLAASERVAASGPMQGLVASLEHTRRNRSN